MASTGRARFINDNGVESISIGVKEFECMGASKPHDHPHIYLDMGQDAKIRCPYCGTLFLYNDDLQPQDAVPRDCIAG